VLIATVQHEHGASKNSERERKNLLNAKPNVRLRLKAHLTMIRHNEERSMNVAESKGLKRAAAFIGEVMPPTAALSPK